MIDTVVLGKRINETRKDRKLTSEKLSEAVDVTPTYMRQIESGAKMPSLPTFVDICDALNVSPKYLLAGQFKNKEPEGMDELYSLMKNASPTQIEMINALVKAALDQIEGQ